VARELILARQPAASVILTKSGGGVFEINVDGRLAYSKRETGRFPTDTEVVGVLG